MSQPAGRVQFSRPLVIFTSPRENRESGSPTLAAATAAGDVLHVRVLPGTALGLEGPPEEGAVRLRPGSAERLAAIGVHHFVLHVSPGLPVSGGSEDLVVFDQGPDER